MPLFVYRSVIHTTVERLFAFHAEPGALARLTPPWAPVHVISTDGGIHPGARVELRILVGPFRIPWVARHTEYTAGRSFVDIQERGPFRRWIHRHEFQPLGAAAGLTDHIEFLLPGGRLVNALLAPLVKRRLRRLFAYRHQVTRAACER